MHGACNARNADRCFLKEFQERLAKFGLELHPEKTRMIEVGRFAQANLYHAIPGNLSNLFRFRERLSRYWRRALARRSQRGRLPMRRLIRLFQRWLPQPRILHPYPEVRFNATHPR